jgi:hypothetical protein
VKWAWADADFSNTRKNLFHYYITGTNNALQDLHQLILMLVDIAFTKCDRLLSTPTHSFQVQPAFGQNTGPKILKSFW